MNKRLYLPLVLILLLAIALSGCSFQLVTGSGKVVTEERSVEAFSAVTLAGIGDVTVTQADKTSLSIEAEDNLIRYFETSVKNDTLTIKIKDEFTGVSLHPTKPVKFHVSTPKVNALTLAGSGNINAADLQTDSAMKISLLGSGNITTDAIKADTVEVNLAGSGNIRLGKVTASNANSTIAGSGDISLGGETASQNAHIVGSGNYLANELKSSNAQVTVTGSGKTQVWVTDRLDVTISGSGDVTYHGGATVNSAVTGSGHITSTD